MLLDVEDTGKEGIGLLNNGFDGIAIKAGEQYDFSMFAYPVSEGNTSFSVQLRGRKGNVYGEASFNTSSRSWKKYAATLMPNQTDDSASLAVIVKTIGKVAMDEISLFPKKTFNNRTNGLRADIAKTIADLKPKFMRFPGGCLVHGDGLANMYRWKNTIGPVDQRVQQRSIWNYHQSVGLGYFEYFQFCEDIGAKPLPVAAAAVSCQNSGGTWRIGSTGQQALPMDEMNGYIQDILDLVEYANGPVSSVWGAKRAAAGHPKPFGLEYIGIGNEDKVTPAFKERFAMIYKALRTKYPEITIVGTVGPSPSGEDYDEGWKLADLLDVPVVDEHYYENPNWFLANTHRYDNYDRTKSRVYIGEYASKGNKWSNALAEGVYMTSLERNGDVVKMASYAPMLANQRHASWDPNLIYFTNTKVVPTVNYYMQQLFSVNQGDNYFSNVVTFSNANDTLLGASCVSDGKDSEVILKLINAGGEKTIAHIDLSRFGNIDTEALLSVLEGSPNIKNSIDNPNNIVTVNSTYKVAKTFNFSLPAYSANVIRVHLH